MKTKLNLSIDVEVAQAARQAGINISMICQEALRARLDMPNSAERTQARKKNPDKLYVPGIGWVDKNPTPFKTEYLCEFKQSKEKTSKQ